MGFYLIYGCKFATFFEQEEVNEKFFKEFTERHSEIKHVNNYSRWNQDDSGETDYLCLYVSQNGCDVSDLEKINKLDINDLENKIREFDEYFYDKYCEIYSFQPDEVHYPILTESGLFNVVDGEIM
jgi:hypothetical protein